MGSRQCILGNFHQRAVCPVQSHPSQQTFCITPRGEGTYFCFPGTSPSELPHNESYFLSFTRLPVEPVLSTEVTPPVKLSVSKLKAPKVMVIPMTRKLSKTSLTKLVNPHWPVRLRRRFYGIISVLRMQSYLFRRWYLHRHEYYHHSGRYSHHWRGLACYHGWDIYKPLVVHTTRDVYTICWPGTGSNFQSQANPLPVVRVGQSGSSGSVEITDIIFSTRGPTPGAIIVEWNVKGTSPASAGMWDSHIRIGSGMHF